MVETTLLSQKAVYTLGKLHSKYLILDILGFANDRLFAKKTALHFITKSKESSD